MVEPLGVGILPVIPVESTVDQSIQDAFWLCGAGGSVEVQVHIFLICPCMYSAVVLKIKVEVKEVDAPLWASFRFPLKAFSWWAEVVHR